MISTTHTLDGVLVEPGLRVWDYDLRPRIVGPTNRVSHGVPWWDMVIPDGEYAGQLGSAMDPSRMWAKHPTTGAKP